jgi:predicted XRE-type DNA-binding protein
MKNLKNFDSFAFEGRAFKDTKKQYAKKASDPDKKSDFRDKVEEHVKSKGFKTKQVGNDLEIHSKEGEMLAQVMFREEYVGVRKKGNKFVDEFEYTELGKIKSKIGNILK